MLILAGQTATDVTTTINAADITAIDSVGDMDKCQWPLGNGQSLEFSIYAENKGWNAVAGLYIFSYKGSGGSWLPLYVGQTNDFSVRLPTHERLNEAVQRGATHIHACVVPHAQNRDTFERMLIQHLRPTMNDQLK